MDVLPPTLVELLLVGSPDELEVLEELAEPLLLELPPRVPVWVALWWQVGQPPGSPCNGVSEIEFEAANPGDREGHRADPESEAHVSSIGPVAPENQIRGAGDRRPARARRSLQEDALLREDVRTHLDASGEADELVHHLAGGGGVGGLHLRELPDGGVDVVEERHAVR